MPVHLHTSSNPPALEMGRAGKESAKKEETKWADLPFASLLPDGSEERECVHCWVNILINSNLWGVEEVGNKEKRGSLGETDTERESLDYLRVNGSQKKRTCLSA